MLFHYSGFEEQEHSHADLPQAAVLVLYQESPEPSLLMVQKASHLRRHAGEIAFPGGKLEPGESHLETAYRECFEEVGIHSKDIELLGHLQSRVTRHKVAVKPYFAKLNTIIPEADLKIDTGEIERAFYVPVSELLKPENFRSREAQIDGEWMHLSYFYFQGEKIWGVTAQIIRELLAVG